MSYTGSHPHNFIPGVTAATLSQSSAAMSAALPDRREVRPLNENLATTAAATNPSSASSSSAAAAAQAQTAHLEAHVRMLEQEVQLLRSGLAQNERLRQHAGTAAAAATPSSPQKRVHFGPSSVVPIPGVVRGGSSTTSSRGGASAVAPGRGAGRAPSTSPVREPQRKPAVSTRAGAAVAPYDVRPRLAFGQRVDPTQSRTGTSSSSSSSSAVATTATTTAASPSVAPQHPTASTVGNASSGAGVPESSSSSPQQQQSREAAIATTNTTYVPLSYAPASLRGSNTCGIPLQGAATGATVVAALDGQPPPAPASSSPSPPSATNTNAAAATVWAAADPALLWKRAAAAAAAEGGGTDGSGGPSAIAHYPFRVATPEPVVKAISTTPATQVSAPPIVVTMSSEGWPPRAPVAATAAAAGGLQQPTSTVQCAAPSPPSSGSTAAAASADSGIATNADAAAAAAAAAFAAVPPPSQPLYQEARAEPQVESLKKEVAALRDTLEQREALLHRVLVELHDRSIGTSTSSAPRSSPASAHREAAEDKAEQSRRTLRLLTQELLAAQTQLGHARASYQLLEEEMQRRPAPQPPQAPQNVPPAPAPSPPEDAELRGQLNTALQKVKAWEDWYATTEAGAANPSDGATPAAAAGAAASSPPAKAEEKTHDKKHTNTEATPARRHNRGCGSHSCWTSDCCPRCGSAPPAAATAATSVPLSTYAIDDALYTQLLGNSRGYASADARDFSAAYPQETPASAAKYFSATGGVRQQRGGENATHHSNTGAESTAHSPIAANDTTQSPAAASSSGARGALSTLSPSPSSYYYCDDLKHARRQAAYDHHFATQLAREAAVRDLAEVERQVAEKRLVVLRQHQALAATPPSVKDSTGASAVKEAVDEK